MANVNSFREAVEATPDVSNGLKAGLTAFGKYSSKVDVGSIADLQGSIDIDTLTRKKYPNSNRWDYAFAYKGEVFFVEIHSANSSEVSVVLRKLQWLKDWLSQQAPRINRLKAKEKRIFYWVQSNGFAIPKTSRQYRAAEMKGLKPVPKVTLNH